MLGYKCVIFDLYNTIIEGDVGHLERERYRLDSIYTILEKSLYNVKFAALQDRYGEMTFYTHSRESDTGRAFPPFEQVVYLAGLLNVDSIVTIKKMYDVYADAILQISPRAVNNAARALEFLRDKGVRIGLISNTGRTPGVSLRMLLKSMGLHRYFDDMVFSDEAGILKPDRMIFDLAVRRLGVKREETIFVGDLKSVDYDGAVNAGLSAHLFRKSEEDLFKLAARFAGGID